ncbi:MAG TPA: sensor histidine kinase [Jiangellaceae bacterium]|nr:sensor histidine kinase [Jiangellaceae bacterium]
MKAAASPAERVSDVGAGFLAFERRWNLAWELLPYLLIAVSYLLTLLTAGLPGAELLLVSLLVVVLLGWHLWFITLHPQWPERRLLPMVIYFVGLVNLALLLSSRAEPFSILVIGCFPMAFVALPGRWAYLGIGVTCLSLLVAIGGTRPGMDLTVQFVGLSVLAAAIGWTIRRIESEAVLRRQAHADLEELNHRLRRANREKEELQEDLVAAAREAGVAAERARLARDFHDTLAQGLAGIGSQLETADELIDAQHPAGQRVRTALELSRSSLAEARRSVNALRPGPLEVDDLLGALSGAVTDWQQQNSVPCRLAVTGTPVAVDLARQTAVLRIVQEGLANVARHADAAEVTVTVSYLDDRVMIDVFDDGAGFDPTEPVPAAAEGGYGLSAARERLDQLGGWLTVESAPGAGTTLTATVPVTDPPADVAAGSPS